MLKRIVSYANDKFSGKQITYTITTNGTLLSKEVIDFLSKNDISLTISLDGPEIIHDGNRIFRDSNKGSFRVVKRNIDKMWEHNPAYAKTVSINMVVDPNNDFSLINSIFDDKNIRKLTFQHSSVEIEDGWIGSSEKYLQEASYHEFLSYMMEMNRVHSKKVAKISRDEMESLKFEIARMEYSSTHKIGAPSGPCVPGKKRLFCNVDGNLFPCERVSEKAECMNIGNITSGFELEKVDALLNISRMNNACKNCWAFSLCKTCAKKVEQNGQLSLNKMLKNCTMAKADAEALIRSKILLDELTTHTAKMWSVIK